MDTTRRGWECGVYTERHIEWLYQCLDKAEIQMTHDSMTIESLKAQRSEGAIAARIPTPEDMREDMIANAAGVLARLSEEDRKEAVAMGESWANGHTYAARGS